MLKSHMGAVEKQLLAISQIPANSGHPLHKGTPREAFIRGFLASHLSESVAIGTGEIIDANSKPNESRNQNDIVIYKRNYPKLDFGGGVNGFLAESVVATIEVKSTLDKADLGQSIKAARNIKNLNKSIVQAFHAGYQPPSVLNYVVAYGGPAKMQTVCKWITEIHASEGISYPPMSNAPHERPQVASPSLDAVFILGKGFIYFDNVPFGFITDEERTRHPQRKWVLGNMSDGNLLLLFIFLTQAVSGVTGSWLNPLPYLANFSISGVIFAT